MAEEKQMVVANGQCDLKCVCGDAEVVIKSTKCIGPPMYYCKACENSKKNAGNRYCNKCGPLLHTIYGHGFDVNSNGIVSINKMLKAKENGDQAGWGKKLLVAMVGEARYKKVEPYVEKVPSVMAVGVSSYVLYSEIAVFMADNAQTVFAAKNVLNAGGITMVIGTLCEMAINAYRWKAGQISGKEWLRLTGKSVVRNGAVFAGMVAGAKIGAVAGTAATPGVGTAVGIIAGAVIGLLCGMGASQLYEKVFPNGEEQAKKEAVREAIKYFHYQEKDIKNEKIFNKKELKRRFKQFALDAHPDRRDGDHSEWDILSQHYGILMGLCEENDSTKKIVHETLAIEHQ